MNHLLISFQFFFFLLPAMAIAESDRIESKLHFTSGADRACSKNCLFVSINGGPYKKIGCNKLAIGICRSPGGLKGEIPFQARPDGCNEIRLKVISQGKDNGVVHESVNSLHAGLIPDRSYHINARTASSVDMWINDNADRDVYDFRVKLHTSPGVPFGITRFVGAECP